jgi:hypothetical protein
MNAPGDSGRKWRWQLSEPMKADGTIDRIFTKYRSSTIGMFFPKTSWVWQDECLMRTMVNAILLI